MVLVSGATVSLVIQIARLPTFLAQVSDGMTAFSDGLEPMAMTVVTAIVGLVAASDATRRLRAERSAAVRAEASRRRTSQLQNDDAVRALNESYAALRSADFEERRLYETRW